MPGLTLSMQARLEEEAAARRAVATVDDQRRALGLGAADVAGDLVAVLAGDQRTHLVVGFAGRTDLDAGDALLDLVDQRVGDRVDGEHDARSPCTARPPSRTRR